MARRNFRNLPPMTYGSADNTVSRRLRMIDKMREGPDRVVVQGLNFTAPAGELICTHTTEERLVSRNDVKLYLFWMVNLLRDYRQPAKLRQYRARRGQT